MTDYSTQIKRRVLSLAEWAGARETAEVVAVAICAVAAAVGRSPNDVWADPTADELDLVRRGVAEYVAAGVFPPAADGNYCWGASMLRLE